MKLVFFGTPEFAIPSLNALHQSSHDVLGVVTSPDKKSGRGLAVHSSSVKQRAEILGIPIYQPHKLNNDELISKLKKINPDIYIVVAYKILPESLLIIPKNGAVNLHASLLPKYRGASPVQHAILNGEKQIGVTTFIIKQEVDCGDILLQKQINIDTSITSGMALEQLSDIGAKLIIRTLKGISEKTIIPKKQKNINATFAPKIKIEKDCRIDWSNTAEYIQNKIRAFSPKPGAFTYYKDKRVKLFGSIINNKIKNIYLHPGYFKYIEPYLQIGTGTTSILIKDIQFEGKKCLPVCEFILGNPQIKKGRFY